MDNRPWLKHYDSGVLEHINYPKIPLQDLLIEAAIKYPARACTNFKGAKISFRVMNEISDRIASALIQMGVKRGDRIGLFMPNTPQFVMTFFGILKAGGVVVAVNPLFKAREIEDQVNDAGIETLFVMSNFYKTLKTLQPNTKIKTLIVTNLKETLPPVIRLFFTMAKEKKGGFRIDRGLANDDIWLKDLIKNNLPSKSLPEVTADDVALFQYSGGTTGIPKAAVALHRNVVANALQIKNWMTTLKDGQETVLMAIPLFHVYGMVAGMLYALAAGATMVMIPNPRDLKDLLQNINTYKPTVFPGVPTLYNAINNHPEVIAGKYNLRSIKACISGSAPLMRETKERFEAMTGGVVFEGYGLSEAPTASHCNPLLGLNKSGSIGMPLSDVDCRIVSLDDGETILPPGEIGELILHGPQVMKGYLNMPTETADALRNLPDGSGPWLYTGDIARMDEDGYFYIVDRKKEMMKPGGYQVWPREVEEIIAMHPKVLEVGVAGIPDPYRGETVKAWVVVKPDEHLSEEEVKTWCKENLAPFKVPTHVEFRSELPKTTVGKILRRELAKEYYKKNLPGQ
jgi:long-chain acyl-CoA synthetase